MNAERIFYTHYKKGGRYEYIGEALHTETGERLVVYKKVFGDDAGKIWVRPYDMFFETVVYEGRRISRFERIPPRAVGVVLDGKGNILLMRRYKPVSGEYFVFPGGGIQEYETPQEAVIREVQEECNLTTVPDSIWYTGDNEGRSCVYFLIRNYSGTLALGGEEKDRANSENQYEPVWVSLQEAVQKTNFYPKNAREKLKELF